MRASGILMPISSLPSPYGIGTMGQQARQFVDFLSQAGQAYWQILPICPTSYGDSPYQSFSTYAGNPYFIDLDTLAAQGLLKPKEYKHIDWQCTPEQINYGALYEKRYAVLRTACERLLASPPADYRDFVRKNRFWLPDYALFMALKDAHGGACWQEWEHPLRQREPDALKAARRTYAKDIAFWQAVQYLFYTQWQALKAYANDKHIQIIGDLPIYIALDSVDVWSSPQDFQLDADLNPTEVAGCPPDYFSADGQLWGNPVYNWTAHKAENYAWWIWRMKSNMALFDVVRLDHFRGFAAYWEVGADEETAINGKWRKGPGMELFNAIEKALGPVPLIAEDLGVQTDEVKKLLEESGFPGMRVLIFGFTPDYDNEHLPHNYKPNSIVYTSTHDSQTVCEQIMDICSEPEKQFAYRYLRTSHAEAMGWSAIKCVWASSANIAMTTLQDLLSLGADSRMNTPATIGGKNWRWRVRAEALNPTVSSMLGEITKTYMRG